jgi:hypothetical protein
MVSPPFAWIITPAGEVGNNMSDDDYYTESLEINEAVCKVAKLVSEKAVQAMEPTATEDDVAKVKRAADALYAMMLVLNRFNDGQSPERKEVSGRE